MCNPWMVAAMHFVHFRAQLWKDTDSTVLYAEVLWQRDMTLSATIFIVSSRQEIEYASWSAFC